MSERPDLPVRSWTTTVSHYLLMTPQVDIVANRLRHCLYLTVSCSFRRPRFASPTASDLIRYPADIAQGTAVPHWAYFNVTVSIIIPIWRHACVDVEHAVGSRSNIQ